MILEINHDSNNLSIIIIIILIIICCMNYYNKNKDITTVKSNVDGRIYMVAKLPDSLDAANKLANINNNILELIKYCDINNNDVTNNFKRLKKYNPNTLSELVDKSKYTAYNINKGEEIAICIRDKNNKLLDDMNSCMFIIIHELAHIMTVTEQHTPEFWENMNQLIDKAGKCGIYTPIDYSKTPKYYCNQLIDKTPYIFK
jgi:hypothetical protein